jgi:hypothetical protein
MAHFKINSTQAGFLASAGIIGAISVALINQRVSASTHYIDAVTERETEARASAVGLRLMVRRFGAAPLEA